MEGGRLSLSQGGGRSNWGGTPNPIPMVSRPLPEHVHPTRSLPPLAELQFAPNLPTQAGILKAGAAGIEFPLKAKHALAQVMVGGCRCRAKIHLPRLALKGALVNLALLSDGALSGIFGQYVLGLACDCECRTVQCV